MRQENTKVDERAMLIKHIIDTHDCFLCKELGWKEKCEQAKKAVTIFLYRNLKRFLNDRN